MNNEIMEKNNVVQVRGRVVGELQVSHVVYGETFYEIKIAIPRNSGYSDILPITVSERLMYGINLHEKHPVVHVTGQLRSYNKLVNNKYSLILTIFARELKQVREEELQSYNQITLNGYICKKPNYRQTPLGREISDILVAVNRSYGKSDYIPVITWGRNAKYSENLQVGTRIQVSGRIQSREYEKTLPNGTVLSRIAYEVSVSKIVERDTIREIAPWGDREEGVVG